MSETTLNASAILKNIFWKNVANVDHLTKVYKHQISLLTITCTAIFVAIKYVKKWKHNEKSACPALRPIVKPTEIVIVDNDELCVQAVNELSKKTHQYRVVGLDCEWVYDKVRHPIALLQLATSDGYCVLIRLSKLSSIPSSLVNFLEDSSIIKVGSAIKSDVHLLHSDYNIRVLSCLDISVAARSLALPSGSLKKLAKDVLDIELNKDKSLQCSNWEVETLSDLQIEYAALDALIPVKIIEKMMLTELKDKVSQELDENEAWHVFLNTWQNVLDVNYSFKNKPNRRRNSNDDDDVQNFKQHKGINIKRALYENCFLQDPEGNVLCVCNNRKLNWYVERGLGIEVSQSPRAVRLNFMPRVFERTPDSLYYMKEKENKCVVCGQTNSLRRKNVVPCEYRTHFPKEKKDYKSHDVVLLCAMCHTRSSLYDQKLRRDLVIRCEAPIVPLKLTEEGRRMNKLKYAANALYSKNPLISSTRIEELKSTVRDILNCDEITDDLLQEIKSMKLPLPDDHSMSHGQKVVKYFEERDELNELEISWRNHFVNSMNPRHLPELWSITHDPKSAEYSNFHKELISYK